MFWKYTKGKDCWSHWPCSLLAAFMGAICWHVLIINISNYINARSKLHAFCTCFIFFRRRQYVPPQLPAKIWDADLSSLPSPPQVAAKGAVKAEDKALTAGETPGSTLASHYKPGACSQPPCLLLPCSRGNIEQCQSPCSESFLAPTANHHSSWTGLFVHATKIITYSIYTAVVKLLYVWHI